MTKPKKKTQTLAQLVGKDVYKHNPNEDVALPAGGATDFDEVQQYELQVIESVYPDEFQMLERPATWNVRSPSTVIKVNFLR